MSLIIKEIRTRTGMTQKEFASNFGIPVSTLRKWEQGESSPPDYVVNLIARALPAENRLLVKITGKDNAEYFYDESANMIYDCKGNGIYISKEIKGVKEHNLGLYLKELFEALYDIQRKFNRDCAYDKTEDILWV